MDDHNGQTIEYTVRESTRAKHVRLTISAQDGLVITVPSGRGGARIDLQKIIHERRDWIMQALDASKAKRAEYRRTLEGSLPLAIEFRAIKRSLSVIYRVTESEAVTARTHDDAVVVSGHIEDKVSCIFALQRCVKREAAKHLAPRVHELSKMTGLSFSGQIRFKLMRSRWGSCSAKGNLALSQNLLFLPEVLTDHVILHELAHTAYLDHSTRFHELLTQLDPEAKLHSKELKEANRFIPAWADLSISK